MQNQKLISDCNVDIGKFWSDVTQYSKDNKMDPTLSYMLLLENKMYDAKIEISKHNFQTYGKQLELFQGVNEWFSRIKEYGKSNNVEIEHYIISSGLTNMIEGCSFYN